MSKYHLADPTTEKLICQDHYHRTAAGAGRCNRSLQKKCQSTNGPRTHIPVKLMVSSPIQGGTLVWRNGAGQELEDAGIEAGIPSPDVRRQLSDRAKLFALEDDRLENRNTTLTYDLQYFQPGI